MADPWNAATPVVGNIVRDTVPPEFIALKQVNLDRPRLGCRGQAGFTYNATTPIVIGPFTFYFGTPVTIPFTQLALYRGTYAGGEYTCDQTGLFAIDIQVPKWGAGARGAGGLGQGTITIQKFTGGAWADYQVVNYGVQDSNNSVTENVGIHTWVPMTTGDKLRVQWKALYNASTVVTISADASTTAATMIIEFMRNPS